MQFTNYKYASQSIDALEPLRDVSDSDSDAIHVLDSDSEDELQAVAITEAGRPCRGASSTSARGRPPRRQTSASQQRGRPPGRKPSELDSIYSVMEAAMLDFEQEEVIEGESKDGAEGKEYSGEIIGVSGEVTNRQKKSGTEKDKKGASDGYDLTIEEEIALLAGNGTDERADEDVNEKGESSSSVLNSGEDDSSVTVNESGKSDDSGTKSETNKGGKHNDTSDSGQDRGWTMK